VTAEERTELQAAVDQINRVMRKLHETHGDKIRVVPRANYNTDEGRAAIAVEVTARVERFE
jgi:hypothetical protein